MYRDIAQLGLLEDEEIVLDEAALALAALDRPGVDLTTQRALLAELAAQLGERHGGARSSYERALALAAVIGAQYGFHGALENYDDPANADLISVLTRRQGMPIALSIVYVALARRLGWTATGLNMPGHLLVLIGGQVDGVVIDPFGGGAIMERQAVVELRARFGAGGPEPEPEAVAALSNRGMLVRLLLNQASRARSGGQLERALIVYQRMTTIAPLLSHLWWDRAELERQSGQINAARASLNAMLETTRDPVLRNHIRAALDKLARQVN